MKHSWWMLLVLASLAQAQRTELPDGRVAEAFHVPEHVNMAADAKASALVALVADCAAIGGRRPEVQRVGERQVIVLGTRPQVDRAREILKIAAPDNRAALIASRKPDGSYRVLRLLLHRIKRAPAPQ